MSTHPDVPTGRVPRRRVLGGLALLGVAPLTGCDDVLADPADDTGIPTAADPDEALLEDAVSAEAALAAAVTSLLQSAPQRLRGDLRRTLGVHVAHLRLLAPSEEPATEPTAEPGLLRVAGLVAAEQRLSRRHTDLAVRAASGQFARVLAGMAAASGQQADLWRGRT